MEHASIAAFARFTLQLLAMGAPADFIEASNAAQVDETRHARDAFSLASVYSGRSVGPDRLSLDGALEEMTWEAIFEATVREGCIGETRAALDAKWAAAQCRDPVVRGVLERIASDELRHAALAWRVAAWMIGKRPELAKRLDQTLRSVEQLPGVEEGRTKRGSSWGVLDNEELSECWNDAWVEIIMPCVRALPQGAPRPSGVQVVAFEPVA
jgi:hypothetical protein